ncbi:MAG: DEAD/DEAH box helicase family protein [Planctomycetaceae bacterium]|nr:DEAD/DEAH box helicase family protein [Planctomycetaceae bacterium]
MQLKEYQKESLETLAQFCDLVRKGVIAGAAYPIHDAYREICGRDYLSTPQFPNTPYICLRVPTGGGKTLIAAHAVGTIAKRLGHQDRPLCLWVTPSTTIRDQTLQGLKDHNHPLRVALRQSLGNEALEVLTIEDALCASKAILSSAAVVVVTTIQSYRKDDTTGRKVYEDNGYLMDHFRELPPWLREQLAEPDDGLVRLSLANVMKMRGPVVIMDEAHNARTKISLESLARFSPLAVLELTATPQKVHNPDREQYASNVLHAVSALQLKQEGMIKLPVELESRNDWLEVLALTAQRRNELEQRAIQFRTETGRYIRPVALLQAQPKSKTQATHTVDELKKALVERLKVPAEHIRIATGEHDDLGVENLRNEKCAVRYVITVDKLREGWDCPFAYILGSVGNVATETAVEQLLGRVMRMPHATPTGVMELDRAYAVVRSENVIETAQKLCDSLVRRCGFDADTINDAMRVHRQDDPQGHLPLDAIPVSAPLNVNDLPSNIRSKIEYDARSAAILVRSPLTQQEALVLRDTLPEADRLAVEEYWQTERNVGTISKPLDRYAEPLCIPRLVVREGKTCTLFEPEELKEFDWNLDSCSTIINEREFSTELTLGRRVEVGVDQTGGIGIGGIQEVVGRQLLFWSEGDAWSKGELVSWLDRAIHHGGAMIGLPTSQSQAWLLRLIDSLIAKRQCDVNVLVRKRHQLAQTVKTIITDHGREQVRLAARSLIDMRNKNRRLETSMDLAVVLGEQCYSPYQQYKGQYRFKRHAFDLIGGMGNEEMLCAAEIDGHPNVRRWMRNLEHESAGGFSLPLSPGRFFPDFLAELNDGRIAMIEYKGGYLAELSTERFKMEIGNLWADRSNGQCVFVWVVDQDWITLKNLLNVVG